MSFCSEVLSLLEQRGSYKACVYQLEFVFLLVVFPIRLCYLVGDCDCFQFDAFFNWKLLLLDDEDDVSNLPNVKGRRRRRFFFFFFFLYATLIWWNILFCTKGLSCILNKKVCTHYLIIVNGLEFILVFLGGFYVKMVGTLSFVY